MFWDRVAGIYDLYAFGYNRTTNLKLIETVCQQINENQDVLECACGTGLLSKPLALRCRMLTATDYSEAMLKKTRSRCKGLSNVIIEKADISHLDYQDQSFDVVVAANVIHLLEDSDAALKEMERVCRKGGKMIVPVYVNKEKTGKENIFIRTADQSGADFKKQFTFSSYRSYIEERYRNARCIRIEGRIPCAVAIIDL